MSIKTQGRVLARLASWPLRLHLLRVVFLAHDGRLAFHRAFRLDGTGGLACGLGKELADTVEHGSGSGLELRFLFRPFGLVRQDTHLATEPMLARGVMGFERTHLYV